MNIGKLQPTNITEEMKKSYLNYAMSVIVSRALPDVKDGLKPVHRRILFAMHEIGLVHSAKYKKSATVVGEVLGKYHPHGDVPVYDALVRLAQDFSMRYPLIDGQGNFGCFTKDTKVQLTDGRAVSFEDLVREHGEGKRNWTFTFNYKEQKIEIAEIKHPRLTKKQAELVEVTLDNGEKIRCTPNHKFMLRSGEYTEAEKLNKGDSLMPVYLQAFEGSDNNLKGYTQIYQPESQMWDFVHHLSDQWNLQNDVYIKSSGKIRHHQDINKLNNNPDNIVRLPWEDHWLLHALLAGLRHKFDPEYVKKIAEGRKRYIETHKDILSKRRSELNKKLWKNKDYRENHSLRMKKHWENDEYREAMAQIFSKRLREKWTDPQFRKRISALKSDELMLKWQDPEYRKTMSEKMKILSNELWNNPEHRIYISEKMKKLANDPTWIAMLSSRTKALWQSENYRKKFSKDHFSNMAKKLWEDKETLALHRKKAIKQWQNEEFRNNLTAAIVKSNKKRLTLNPDMMVLLNQKAVKSLHEKWKDPEYKARVVKSKTLRFVSSLLMKYNDITPVTYEKDRLNNGTPKLKKALIYFKDFSDLVTQARVYNHKVISVKKLTIKEDVFDLTIDTTHNFALASGVFVHNSIDGDPPAAMRYTEARMAAITSELLIDIEKETVDFMPNFDASKDEPMYLPAKLPNLLLMGSEGIAVGMATKIPPHNLGEVIDAITYMLSKIKIAKEVKELDAATVDKQLLDPSLNSKASANFINDVTIDELLEFIKGPDFPTAGAIYDITEIKNAYITGRGKIVIRGKAEIEEIGNGKSAITVTELPYQVNKALLIAKIADLAKEKKIDGISDLRDESDRRGLRIYIELKRDAVPKKVLNNLFKHTSLQTTFPVNMVALVDGTPQTLNLKLILEEYIKHRYDVIKRRSEFELRQAKARLHILEGLKIAVDNIDAVIRTIRESKTQEDAKQNLMTKFKLSEIQSTAILDMQLRRLAALERQKIEDELQMIKETIAYLEDLLAHGDKILAVIKSELTKLKEKYADPRKTKVYKGKVGEFSEEDLIPNEPTVITLTNTGYIKRQSLNAFHTQNRGGKGITGMNVKEEDGIFHIRSAQTHDNILFFTNKGKAYALRAYEISESSRTSKGSAIVNLLNIEAGEKVESFVVYDKSVSQKYVFLTTRNGTVKKTHISEFENIRRNGMIAIKLDPGDELAWSNLTDGKSNVLIITKGGKAIKFNEDAVRPLGRATMGVRGIKIDSKDQVIGMDVITKGNNPELFVIMENGLGKKTTIDQFPLQNRGGQGVKVAKVTDKTGQVVTAQIIPQESESIIITSKKGQIVKLSTSSIPKLSRDTQGVILMRFSHSSDGVASATCL